MPEDKVTAGRAHLFQYDGFAFFTKQRIIPGFRILYNRRTWTKSTEMFLRVLYMKNNSFYMPLFDECSLDNIAKTPKKNKRRITSASSA